ncbi:MAG TPA: deoxyribodipyrimidine photo-lyase [Myxococcota bacterium]|nr:deoxyribodipyrimidine photo-lyase [Myxococcota bacterium]
MTSFAFGSLRGPSALAAGPASIRALHWFRSDLRVADNTALLAAAARAERLTCVFVLDDRLLRGPGCAAPRVRFLLDCLSRLAGELERRGSALVVRRGDPAAELVRLAAEARAELVTWNRDYGPFARARDARVTRALERAGVRVQTHRDRVVFESDQVRTRAGRPFSVYTPYRRAWLERWSREPAPAQRAPRLPPPIHGVTRGALPAAEPGPPLPAGGSSAALRRLDAFLERALADYAWRRDLPAEAGTSRLSAALRFGTVSVRTCLARAAAAAADDRRRRSGAAKWRDELVWREFYHAVLAENPRVLTHAWRPELDSLEWNDDEAGLRAWCAGRTGYPFVDAGMRELVATGWMHNRARMAVASFLTKDLGIDWRRGEAFFMQSLVDGDPASNNGGWQWAASTGSDAQPWFRIFNPVTQGERFDPDGRYVRRWLPELRRLRGARAHRPWQAESLARGYPPRIVDHAEARAQALARFRAALAQKPFT